MSTKPVIGIQGLKTSGNELGFPAGSLTQADNCIIPSKGVAQPRRGQGFSPAIYIDNNASDTLHNRAKEFWQWGQHLFISYSGDSGYGLSLYEGFGAINTGSPTYHSIGALTPPAPTIMRMKFAELAKAAHWTTAAGLYTLDVPSGTARKSGIPAPLTFVANPTATGGSALAGNPNAAGSWLPKNCQVGARAVLGLKDSNDVVHLSKPNGRHVLVNPNDVTALAGSLVISSNVVTATVTSHNFHVGDVLNLSATDSGAFNQNNNVVTAITATTIVWAQTHADHTSGVDITLTSGTKSATWIVLLPAGLTAGSHFIQIYRTDISASDAIDPGDECSQCYERYLTATDISNGYVSVTDNGPVSPPGPALPTNVNTGDGPLFGPNERPPLCRDICVWDGRLWGGATTDSHRLSLRLLGTGSPNGLQTNDVVCLNDWVIAPTVVTQFGPTQNVLLTLNNIAYSHWLATTSGVFSRVLMTGLDDGTFGEFMLEEDGVGGGYLYAGTSRTTAFGDPLAPAVAVTNASTSRTTNVVTVTATAHGFTSGQSIMLAGLHGALDSNFARGIKGPITVTDANTFTYAESGSNATMAGGKVYYVYGLTFKSNNGQQPLRFSKGAEPECWPTEFTPGSGGNGIPDGADVLRIKATPDNGELLVLLNNGDLYAVSGQFPYFVRRVTGSTYLVAADSLVEHADHLFGLTAQGAASIGGNGISLISGDVDDDLRQLANDIAVGAFVTSEIFGVSYESDHQYQLWTTVPAAESDLGYASKSYVFDSSRGGWSNFTDTTRTCGLVFKGLDYLFLGDATSNALRIERKVFSVSPDFHLIFADEKSSAVVDGDQDSSTITTTGLPSWMVGAGRAGAVVQSAGDIFYRVVVSDSDDSNTFTVVGGPLNASNLDVLHFFRPFTASVSFAIEATGAPGVEKSFREVQLHFSERLFATLTVNFTNEHTDTPVPVTLSLDDTPIGEPIKHLSTLRVDVPQSMQRSAMLKVQVQLQEAFGYFKLLGYSATSEAVSERTGR